MPQRLNSAILLSLLTLLRLEMREEIRADKAAMITDEKAMRETASGTTQRPTIDAIITSRTMAELLTIICRMSYSKLIR